MTETDVIVIGAGPAGCTAAIYLCRAGFKPLIFGGAMCGGQLLLTHEVENYPGFENPIAGTDLMMKMHAQCKRLGSQILTDEVKKHSGLMIILSIKGSERRLEAETEMLLFRIVQESLRNVWRHAEATEAQVKVEFSNKIKITIKDNGKGFAVPDTIGDLAKDGRLGLVGMHERVQLIGGTLKMKSRHLKGTTVIIDVPI